MHYYKVSGGIMASPCIIDGAEEVTQIEYNAIKEVLVPDRSNEDPEAEYWRTIDYGEAVNTLIRERYTESQEFAIMRQRDEKPTEFAEYYAFCEECKQTAKAKKEQYGEVV